MLPAALKLRAINFAKEHEISFAELVRRCLESKLKKPQDSVDAFLVDEDYFDKSTPMDLSTNIDDYLYGKSK